MKRKPYNIASAKRRTTLTLPVETLSEAKRIASARKVNLSTVISEALSEGLRQLAAVGRSQQGLNSFLFDTSAESWLARTQDSALQNSMSEYLARHPVQTSAVTVVERIRDYALLWKGAPKERRTDIEAARTAYLAELGQVWPMDAGIAVLELVRCTALL